MLSKSGIENIICGGEIEIAITVDVHRLKIVVVAELRKPPLRDIGKRARAVVLEEEAALTHLAGDQDVEVIVVVDVHKLKLPGEQDQHVGHTLCGGVCEVACSIVEP